MADERIEVEWIATANKMVQVLDRLESKFDKQEKQLQKISDTSKKSADAAAGSFNKLEQELKQAEAALKGLTVGTAAFDAQKKKVTELASAFSKVKTEVKGASGELGGIMSKGVAQLAQVAGGMQALHMLGQALVAELEKVKQLRLDAATTTRSVEQSIAAMALNIGADNVAEARQLIEQKSPEFGVTQEGLANLIASAISGGAKDLQEAVNLSELTLKLTAGDAQKAAPIMSGMLTLASTTGNRNFGQVLGQLSQFQEAARGEDLATSINNMSTAMAAANARGERVQALGGERTLELSSVISQVLQDPRMSVTGTTLRQMVQNMDTFIPQAEATLDDGTKSTLDAGTIAAFNQLNTIDARMKTMRSNAELAKQFLSTIENNEGKVAIRELVTGSARVREMERAAAGIVTPDAQAGVDFQKLISVISENTLLSQAENRAAANLQRREAGSDRSIEGQAIKIVESTLDKINLSGLDMETRKKIQWGMEAAMLAGETAPQAAIQALTEAQQQRRAFGVMAVGGQLSAEDRDLLQRQIAVLEQLEQVLQARQQPPAVRVQAPAQRPKEAPLPAATVP